MKLTITIETSGAAFEDSAEHEVCRILTALGDRLVADRHIADGYINFPLYDVNGNRCGHFMVEP